MRLGFILEMEVLKSIQKLPETLSAWVAVDPSLLG